MHLPKELEEVVLIKGWSDSELIQLFSKYTNTYNLSEHFVSYLFSQPAIDRVDLSLLSSDLLLSMVSSHHEVQRELSLVSNVASEIRKPWDEVSASMLLDKYFKIDIQHLDSLLVKDLLNYLNQKHLRLIEAKLDLDAIQQRSGKYRFGARGG